MLKLEKARVKELEGQIKQMSAQVEQHEMALHQQMEQQRLRWKSEIVSSNSMLNTVRFSVLHCVHRPQCLVVPSEKRATTSSGDRHVPAVSNRVEPEEVSYVEQRNASPDRRYFLLPFLLPFIIGPCVSGLWASGRHGELCTCCMTFAALLPQVALVSALTSMFRF